MYKSTSFSNSTSYSTIDKGKQKASNLDYGTGEKHAYDIAALFERSEVARLKVENEQLRRQAHMVHLRRRRHSNEDSTSSREHELSQEVKLANICILPWCAADRANFRHCKDSLKLFEQISSICLFG